jgi:hypothetical protein
MKLLVATARTQGGRDNDYNWCIEVELVRIGEVCAWDRADPDGGCGCGRGFGGLNSHRATTTAMVVDTLLSRANTSRPSGPACSSRDGTRAPATQWTKRTPWLRWWVGDWPVGTVVERRLDELVVREIPGREY